MNRPRGRSALCLAALLITAGCGSTVQTTSAQSSGATGLDGGLGSSSLDAPGIVDGGDGIGAPGEAGGSSVGGGSELPGGIADPGTDPSGTGDPGSLPPGTVPPGTDPGQGQGTGTGSGTKAPLEIGVAFFSSASLSAFSSAAGGSNSSVTDAKAQVRAVVEYVNARGGIAGHPVKPVITELELANTSTFAQQAQEICSDWTEDHKVVAGLWIFGTATSAVMNSCSASRGFVYSQSGAYLSHQAAFAKNPLLVVPEQIIAERWAPTMVSALATRDFFGTAPQIGIIYFDDEPGRAGLQGLKKSLAARNLSVAFERPITPLGGLSDTGRFAAEIQNAVLAFQQRGIDHVIPVLPGSGALGFMQTAEGQAYFPKYGLSSLDLPSNIVQQSNGRNQRSMQNTTAIGWVPVFDVAAPQDPGGNPAAAECRKIFVAGQAAGSRMDEWNGIPICDFIMLLRRAGKAFPVGANLTGASLAGAIRGIGNYDSATTFQARFTSSRRDGVAAVRAIRFDTGCRCFTYLGGDLGTAG